MMSGEVVERVTKGTFIQGTGGDVDCIGLRKLHNICNSQHMVLRNTLYLHRVTSYT